MDTVYYAMSSTIPILKYFEYGQGGPITVHHGPPTVLSAGNHEATQGGRCVQQMRATAAPKHQS